MTQQETGLPIYFRYCAGNIVDVTQNITLNQENDKPVTSISEPVEGQNFGDEDPLFVRGIANDPDGVKAVRILFDGNEPIVQETKGKKWCLQMKIIKLRLCQMLIQ